MAIATRQASSSVSTTNVTSYASAYGSTPLQYSLLLVAVRWGSGVGTATCSVTDNRGNTYTAVSPPVTDSGNNEAVQLFYCVNNSTLGITAQATLTVSQVSGFTVAIQEYTGTDAAAPFYSVKTATGSGTAASVASTTLPTGALCVVLVGNSVSTTTYAAGSGFILRVGSSAASMFGVETFVNPASATTSGSMTLSSSGTWCELMAAFTAIGNPGYIASGASRSRGLAAYTLGKNYIGAGAAKSAGLFVAAHTRNWAYLVSGAARSQGLAAYTLGKNYIGAGAARSQGLSAYTLGKNYIGTGAARSRGLAAYTLGKNYIGTGAAKSVGLCIPVSPP